MWFHELSCQFFSNPVNFLIFQIKIYEKLIPIWAGIIIITVCLAFSSLFSGLNLGLMSMDITDLKILCNTGKLWYFFLMASPTWHFFRFCKREKVRPNHPACTTPRQLLVVFHPLGKRTRQFHLHHSFGRHDLWVDSYHLFNIGYRHYGWDYSTSK